MFNAVKWLKTIENKYTRICCNVDIIYTLTDQNFGFSTVHLSFHSSKVSSGPHHSSFLGNLPYFFNISFFDNPPRCALFLALENLCFHVLL